MFRIKCTGKENIPKEGGCILALNHRSNLDVILIGTTCPRHLKYMAKAELFKNKLFGALIKSLGAFPVHRNKGDVGAIKSALSKLADGEMVLMFPEGRRVKDERCAKAKPGAAMLAVRAQIPILPAYISGRFGFMQKLTVTYGEPIYFTDYYGTKPNVETLQALSDDMMAKIRSLKVTK